MTCHASIVTQKWLQAGAGILLPALFIMAAFNSAGGVRGNAAPGQLPGYVSRVWRTRDGLPESKVRALAQTPDGYLWIGTPSGLARFDGVRFVVFARFNTPSMTDDNIRALVVGKDGSLWVGTDGGGLLHYKNGSFESFGAKEGLENDFVGAVLEDARGDIWVGTNRGLFRGHLGHYQRIDTDLHLANIAFFGLSERRDGQIFAVGPSGIFTFLNGRLIRYGEARQEEIYHMATAADGSLWLGTNRGLRIIDSPHQISTSSLSGSTLNVLTADRAGNMWVGTDGLGLFLARTGDGTISRAPASLPDNNVSAILDDREGNVWVGTADGLAQLSIPAVSLINSRTGLSDDSVSTIYCDHNGVAWLTTLTGKIYQYFDQQVKAVHLPFPADGLRMRGTFEDRTGAFWFGTTSEGVVRVSKGKATRYTMKEGLRNNGFQAFFEDRAGNLWIGTTSGLSRWDGDRFTNFYLESGLTYGWIRAIAEDQNGDLLIGTDRGLNRFHDGRFVYDAAFARLGHDKIWSIFRDAENTLWIATPGAGLVRAHKGTVSRITNREGLPGNSVYQVIGDAGGRLWMSGPLGLSSASLTDLNAVADGNSAFVPVLSYGLGDGLESTQMNGGVQASGCVAADGELWFASTKGALHFRPGHSPVVPTSPVRVEAVRIDDQVVPAGEEVIAGAGRRRVEIDFTACNLHNPERVNFRYKLEGYDTDWVTPIGHRTAIYNGLPPGRYRFEVAARDGALGNTSTSASVILRVEPRFYQTYWFYAVVTVAAVFGVAGVFLFQEKQVRDRYKLRLAERASIAREMHDTIVQGCIGVSTLIEAAVGSARSDPDQMLECLDNARIHLRLTLDEARQELSVLRHDSFRGGLASALTELASPGEDDTGVRVTVDLVGSVPTLIDSTNRILLLVAREAIRNAVAHGGAREIRIVLSAVRSGVNLAITDNGRGFEAKSAKLLVAAGHFGILGMRERMEQAGGSLDVWSAKGKGTIVTAHLPVG